MASLTYTAFNLLTIRRMDQGPARSAVRDTLPAYWGVRVTKRYCGADGRRISSTVRGDHERRRGHDR